MRLGFNKLGEDSFSDAKFVLSVVNGRFNGKKYKVNTIVSGFIASEIGLAGGNSYTSPFEDSDKVKQLMKGIKFAKGMMGMLGGDAGGDVAVLSKSQTMLFYSGSQKPSFSVEAVFITTDSSDKKHTALAKVKSVMSLVYPTAVNGGEVLEAPMGYMPSLNPRDTKGTVTLRVGNWFKARWLVVKDANFTMSKEITKDGTPLYATGTITLEPYRTITYKEYLSWFLK